MTVSAQTPINRSTGNGATTVFPYTFKIISEADIEVSVDDVVKTLNVDYTVSGVGSDSGGNVTMTVAPASLTTVVRRRDMALVRTTDYQDQGELPAATLDQDIDSVVLMVQQVDEQIGRSIKFSGAVSGFDNMLPSPTPNYYLRVKSGGDGLEFVSMVTPGAFTLTPFGEILVNSSDAASARTSLVAAKSGANTDITSLSGPALGAATATTQTAGDSSTKVATTAFVTGGSVALTGAQTIAGVKTFSSQPVLPQALTLGTAKALSASSSTFTSIPSWVNRITVSFIGVSTNGSANVILRLGSAGGGIVSAGYGGSTSQLVSGSPVAVATPTTYAGVGVYPAAGAFFSGSVVLTKITSTSWAISINVGYYANNAVCSGAYAVDISNVLDRLELSTTDIFDAGSWNILYE